MKEIRIEIKETARKYVVVVAQQIFTELIQFIKKKHGKKKVVVIIDNNLEKLYKASFLKGLEKFNPLIITVPPGEKSKSREQKENIEDIMLDNKLGRDTLLVGFGGGVVGDICGFVASTYNRGLPFVLIPTSLLAMADASIGGKNGINTEHGKNLIGTIYQPDNVFIGLGFLKTLPEDEFLSGLAEIVKISAISDKELFAMIEESIESILKREANIMSELITKAVQLKVNVITKDPEEKNRRQVLNFGHTIGHAIESINEFNIKHGFCVSIGMAVESRIAVLSGYLKKTDEKRLLSLLTKLGLPCTIDKEIDHLEIIERISLDKKARQSKPRFVILDSIGKTKSKNEKYSFEIEEAIIKKSIEMCKHD